MSCIAVNVHSCSRDVVKYWAALPAKQNEKFLWYDNIERAGDPIQRIPFTAPGLYDVHMHFLCKAMFESPTDGKFVHHVGSPQIALSGANYVRHFSREMAQEDFRVTVFEPRQWLSFGLLMSDRDILNVMLIVQTVA